MLSTGETMGSFSSSLCILLLLVYSANHALLARSASPVNACLSWRLNVETRNFRNWAAVPPGCVDYVADYMTSGQYELDYSVAIGQCEAYMQTLEVSDDGKDAWVLDIDDTALSNLPYYANHKYGGDALNSTTFDEWVLEGKAPAVVGVLDLFNQLRLNRFKVFFVSERDDTEATTTAENLRKVGYKDWSGLMLRGTNDQGKPSVEYKSEKRRKLVKGGYRIWGNVGDQWSDLSGRHRGRRTFKLPNPMYYSR